MHRAVAKKKILAQEMGQKKNSSRLKIPHPPHHFSNGPSLNVNKTITEAILSRIVPISLYLVSPPPPSKILDPPPR